MVAAVKAEAGMPRIVSRTVCRAAFRHFKFKASLARVARLAEAEASDEEADAV